MATTNDLTHSSDSALGNLVKCAICLDYYKDPRILPCSHTFCYQCIRDLCRERSSQCPMRDNAIINPFTISQLPVNRTAQDLVEHIVKSQHEKSSTMTEAKCDECQLILSEYYCNTCSKTYCTTCLKNEHDLRDFEMHKIDVLINDKADFLCSEHVEQKRKYFCNQCEEMVCSDCLLFQHKNHSFLNLQQTVQGTKKKFYASLVQLSSMKKNLQNLLKTAYRAYMEHYETHTKTKNEIQQIVSNLQTFLEVQKQRLTIEAQRQDASYQETIQQQLNYINEQLKIILIRIIFTKQICNTEDGYQIIKMENDLITYNTLLEEQYEELMQGFEFNKTQFIVDTNLLEIKQQLEKLGEISFETFLADSEHIHPLLKLSKSFINESYMKLDGTYAYGYRFQLVESLKFQAVRVKLVLFGNDLSVYILDYNDILIQTETICGNSQNSTISQWFTIPITCEIQNNYYVFVWLKPKGEEIPLIAHQFGNPYLRTIKKNVSVRSKRAQMGTSMNFQIGTKFNVVYDALFNNDETVPCIDMLLYI